MISSEQIKLIIEAVLLAAEEPVNLESLIHLFANEEVSKQQVLEGLDAISCDCQQRSFELVEVASGYVLRIKQNFSVWIDKLREEKPARYSRTILETLALIAYKQPVTRAEIEAVRGVAVNTATLRTLMERGWIKIVGHRDVPGKPCLYATTKNFLNDLSLKSLEELPPLAAIRDLENADEIN